MPLKDKKTTKKTTARKNPPQTPPRPSGDTGGTRTMPTPQEDVLRALAEFLRAGAKLLTTANEQMQREDD